MTIKLSELPVNTIIEDDDYKVKYLKTEKYIWKEISSCCEDCSRPPLDERESVKVPFSLSPYIEVTKSVDEFIGNYTIISLPMPVIHTAIWLGDKLHNPSAKTVVEDAIKYELVTERDNDEEL